jgi:hypothetical protein
LIKEFLNADNKQAITSDLWHVVHADWTAAAGTPHFVRSIISEHEDSASALRSARLLKAELVGKMRSRPKDAHDQVMVKRPSSETLKSAGRLVRSPK